MSKFKVTLEFLYDSTESLSDWNGNYPVEYVTTEQEALDVAYCELENNIATDFDLKVEEIDDHNDENRKLGQSTII